MIKKFEDIKVPIEVGDTVLGGRFKNKKTIVKKIGKNKKGDITISDWQSQSDIETREIINA